MDGLVVLTGGGLSLGISGGVLVGLDGPGGRVSALSARNGRLIVQAAGDTVALADVNLDGAQPVWSQVEMSMLEAGSALSGPVLSPRGDLVAFAAEDPGSTASFQVVVVDVGNGNRRTSSIDREPNGPPVWIDDSSLLVEVLPIPGGTRFLRLDITSGSAIPVRADGFGPEISGDGSLLAVASSDGSVMVRPATDWLDGKQPDEGAVVDTSGRPFGLALDRTGTRIAIGYADDAGDPASIAILVHEGGRWRRSATPVRSAAGTVTMLGWLN